MKDYSADFPVEPVVGWTTTNYRDSSRNGEVQQVQGFKGCSLEGERLTDDYNKDMIAVPEGRFHTSGQFFQATPEQAIDSALKEVDRLNERAEMIMASVRRVQALTDQSLI